jgi:hypothetical protein
LPEPESVRHLAHAEVALGVCAFAFGLPIREARFGCLVSQTVEAGLLARSFALLL